MGGFRFDPAETVRFLVRSYSNFRRLPQNKENERNL